MSVATGRTLVKGVHGFKDSEAPEIGSGKKCNLERSRGRGTSEPILRGLGREASGWMGRHAGAGAFRGAHLARGLIKGV